MRKKLTSWQRVFDHEELPFKMDVGFLCMLWKKQFKGLTDYRYDDTMTSSQKISSRMNLKKEIMIVFRKEGK
jgi:hypothetical protein